ncbi:MAG: hypothetical protein WC865_03330 [Bacteroidales bacterium]
MEEIGKQIETLLERAVEYGKTTIELTKLNAIGKISDVAGSLISKIVGGAALFLFILFASLGLAFWLGEILGKIYFGFFAVAAIYGLLGTLIHLFLSKWIKKQISNYIIKSALY